MARARSPNSIKAEEMYQAGMKLIEIAKKLGVPDGTVRRWKSTQKWGENQKGKNERSGKKEKTNVRKPGAPKGNQNAKGHGAPERNKNAVKHGGYSAVYWDSLDEEEMDIVNGVPDDEEELLIGQIALFSINERRLMKAIAKHKDIKGGQYISGVMNFEDKRKFKDEAEEKLYNDIVENKVKNKERLPGQKYSIQTSTNATVDLIIRIEKELANIQSKKTKAIEALARLRLEKQKMAGESKGNEVVRTWAEKVKQARGASHE